MATMISGIILLSIGVVVLANVFISTVKATNTTAWSTGEAYAPQDVRAVSGYVGNAYDRCDCVNGCWCSAGVRPCVGTLNAGGTRHFSLSQLRGAAYDP